MTTAAGTRTVAVVGGGIAGLAAAWELTTSGGDGPRVIVFESDDVVGGKLRTTTFGDRPVDVGPDAFVARRPEALALCRQLGLEHDLVAPGVRRAYVWARGRLRPLPAGLALGVPTRLGPLVRSGICSPTGLVGPALDLLRRAGPAAARPGRAPDNRAKDDRAVGPLVRGRLGDQVAARLAGPLIGGIHAGSVETMSAAAVFPALLEADRRPGSLMRALRATLPPATAAPSAGVVVGDGAPVFLTVRGGMARLAAALGAALTDAGVELRLGQAVRTLDRGRSGDAPWLVRTDAGDTPCGAVVLATPTPTAAALLAPHDAGLAALLTSITYASVAIITLRYPRDVIHHALDASGFLVPRAEKGAPDPLVTACTWLTTKWPELDRAGDVVVRVSVGRAGDRRHERFADDELVAAAAAEIAPMMDLRGPPAEALVTRWPEAFPQYAVGHPSRVLAIEAAAARWPGLALAGAALHGVGIPACIGSGRRAARAVLGVPAP